MRESRPFDNRKKPVITVLPPLSPLISAAQRILRFLRRLAIAVFMIAITLVACLFLFIYVIWYWYNADYAYYDDRSRALKEAISYFVARENR